MAALTQRLDDLIARSLDAGRVVGGHLVVAEDGEVVYDRPYGLADREAGRAMPAAPLFRLASVTKPIVSVAAQALREAGLIAMTDPVTRYLPEFRPRLADGSEPVITLSHLLTHMSGLTYNAAGVPAGTPPGSSGLDTVKVDMAENMRRLGRLTLAYAPGSSWMYSLGIDVMGGVMEVATGATLPEIVRSRVTGPLGLTDTDFTVREPDRLAVPYALIEGRATRMADPQVVAAPDGTSMLFSPGRAFATDVFPSGGAGMIGGARDVLRVLETVRQGGGPVLHQQESLDLLSRNAAGDFNTGVPGRGFSHGWSIFHTPAVSGLPHSPGTWAWGGVYGHTWFVDPVRRLTMVSLTNTAELGRLGLSPDCVLAVYGA